MGRYPGGKIVRITPTLSTAQYAQGDVLFNPTEIKLGTRDAVRLTAMYIVNQNTTNVNIDFIFMQKQADLGTINETANVDDPTMESMKIIGFLFSDGAAMKTAQCDTFAIQRAVHDDTVQTPILLAPESGGDSVYVGAILTGSGTPTYAADDIDIVLHLEYLS